MPRTRILKDEEIPAASGHSDDPWRGQVIKPQPWNDDASELEDAYTRARRAAAHGLTGRDAMDKHPTHPPITVAPENKPPSK